MIILIRNPVKVFIAEFNRKTAGKMKETKPSEFFMRGWSQFLSEQITEYDKFYSSWIKSKIPKTIACFEDLEKEPVKARIDDASFLHLWWFSDKEKKKLHKLFLKDNP